LPNSSFILSNSFCSQIRQINQRLSPNSGIMYRTKKHVDIYVDSTLKPLKSEKEVNTKLGLSAFVLSLNYFFLYAENSNFWAYLLFKIVFIDLSFSGLNYLSYTHLINGISYLSLCLKFFHFHGRSCRLFLKHF